MKCWIDSSDEEERDYDKVRDPCCICFEEMGIWYVKTLEACGHKFHRKCIERWE